MTNFRKRYDDNGNEIGGYRVPFEDIPEDFIIKDFTKDIPKLNTASQLMALNHLYQTDSMPPFVDKDIEYIRSSLRELALSYVVSADTLRQQFHQSIKPISDSNDGCTFNPCYHEPCGYCCRHAVELLLKYFIYVATLDVNKISKTHKINDLWLLFKSYYTDDFTKFDSFISLLTQMDEDGSRLRYGCNNKGQPYSLKSYIYDIDALVDDTKCLFNLMYKIRCKGDENNG